MKKFVCIALLTALTTVFVNGCRSTGKPDGIKSETYTKETTKTEHLVIE